MCRSSRTRVKIYCIAGVRNAGKTFLIERLIAIVARRELRTAVIKHHGHLERLDERGKDTDRALSAGAAATILSGAAGLVMRIPARSELDVCEMLSYLPPVDLVLAEGYFTSNLPKVLVRRAGYGDLDPFALQLPLVAVAGDGSPISGIPLFPWESLEDLADYLLDEAFTRSA
jgi:molybdopterin-guanine dinucleotide biosynthesis protein MobB